MSNVVSINASAVEKNLKQAERITRLLSEVRVITPETADKLAELNELLQVTTDTDRLIIAFGCTQYVYDLMLEQQAAILVYQQRIAQENQEVH